MNYQHKILASGHWQDFSLIEQMANIGSEVERTILWKEKKNVEYSRRAFERALELLDLTITDPKNAKRLKEVTRVRELFCDFFIGNNLYHQTADQWQKYFYQFAYLAQIRKGN